MLTLRVPLGVARKTTVRADRLLLRLARKHHLQSATQLLEMWNERISKYTVHRRLRERGLRSYRLLRKPLLSQKNIKARLHWAENKVLYNPIENVWDYIGRKLHSDLPENLNKLKLKLREIWKNMPQDFIVTLIGSMNRRISAVITARGLHTRY